MKKHFTLLIFLLLTISLIRAQKSDVYIHSDTTWADTVLIHSDVFIDSNVTLTVLPGTFVNVQGYYAIYCYGTINAQGTASDSIYFTHQNITLHNDTSTTKGGWHGIRLMPRTKNDTSVFKYCSITNGKAVVPGVFVTHSNNYPDNRGANIFGIDFGSLIFENCLIGNGISKGDGGGVFLENGNYVSIDSCHFKNNYNIYVYGGGACIRYVDNLIVKNNLFNYNKCFYETVWSATGAGGALMVANALDYDAFAEITNNKFFNNYTLTGILYDAYYNSVVSNNLICNNYGTGLWQAHLFNYPIISNNTIAFNSANMWAGIEVENEDAIFINNIVWMNKYDPQFHWSYFNDPPTVLYSDVYRGFDGEGNLNVNPLFTDPPPGFGDAFNGLDYDYSLSNNSPLINAGVPDTTGWNIPSTDFFGNPRIYGGRIDIGAIENQLVVSVRASVKNETSFYLYPNPATNTLTIKTALTGNNIHLHINDVSGREILTQTVYNGKTVNVSRLKSGIYFYRLTAKNGTVIKTGKWVKL